MDLRRLQRFRKRVILSRGRERRRGAVLPVEPRAYVFVPSGASCRVGRWAAAHASDAAEGYGSLVCVATLATGRDTELRWPARRSDHKAAKAASEPRGGLA